MKKLTADEIYIRFANLKLSYSQRDARLAGYAAFYDGEHWENDAEEGAEEIRLTLNYARRAVLWHTAYLTGKPPRVDVPVLGANPSPAARRREQYLRAISTSRSFRQAHRRTELTAAKYGFGIFQVLWEPPAGQPETMELAAAEGSTAPTTTKAYTEIPFRFRTIAPDRFYPRYRTYDHPDDFLYVIRYDPYRLIEDIEDTYDVDLQPTRTDVGTPGGTCDLVEYWDDKRYMLLALTMEMYQDEDDQLQEHHIPHVLIDKSHPYGRPPFFVLPNLIGEANEDPTDGGSLSEIELIEDLNKHLDLVFSLEGTEVATRINPPAVYKTDEPQQDVKNIRLGAGEVIPIGLEEELEPMHWPGFPQAVVQHRDGVMQALRDLSGLPKTSFGEAQLPSGVGMRLSYAALELALSLKTPEREGMLEDLFSFILRVTASQLKGKTSRIALWRTTEDQGRPSSILLEEPDVKGMYRCRVKYGNLIPRNKVEWEQHVVYMYKTGVIPLRLALELMDDVEDPDGVIEQIKAENEDVSLNPEKAAMIKQIKDQGKEKPDQQEKQGAAPGQPPPGQGIPVPSKTAAPPVPTFPSTPTQQNVPYLERGQVPNLNQFGQAGPGFGPGVNPGPPMEQQG